MLVEHLLSCHRLLQQRVPGGAARHPGFQPFQVHHLAMLGIIVTHGEEHLQESLLAVLWKVRAYREAAVVKGGCGRQYPLRMGVDGAIVGPSFPIQVQHGTCIGLTPSQALERL
jgi:hypothetical protein